MFPDTAVVNPELYRTTQFSEEADVVSPRPDRGIAERGATSATRKPLLS